MTKYQVVFHLDEGDKVRMRMTLKNIENLVADLGEKNIEIELVTNGQGVMALLKQPNAHGDQIARLAQRGVHFAACANSLRQMDLAADALLDSVQVVPTGVGELVRRQADGWAYVRP
jgi:uncharacterized protein